MKATRTFWLCLLAIGFAFTARATEPVVTHLAPLVSIDLVGTAEYRIHATAHMLPRDKLRPYVAELLKHAPVHPDRRYSIALYSYGVSPPNSVVDTPKHIAPVLEIAREFECDVYIIHPDEAGFNIQDMYDRIVRPARKHRR
jgi:hypothetical protein